MSGTRRKALLKALALGFALVLVGVPAAATADGLPVVGVDVGSEGVAARTSPIRYVTLRAGRETIVARTAVAGGTPFLHALDTSKRQARCIDLPMLSGRQDLGLLRITIASDQAKLSVGSAGQKLALVDTRDFRASAPAKPTATKPSQTVSHHSDRTWLLFGVAALATVLAASTLSVARRRRRKRLAATA